MPMSTWRSNQLSYNPTKRRYYNTFLAVMQDIFSACISLYMAKGTTKVPRRFAETLMPQWLDGLFRYHGGTTGILLIEEFDCIFMLHNALMASTGIDCFHHSCVSVAHHVGHLRR